MGAGARARGPAATGGLAGVALAGTAAVLLAGCGGGSAPVVRPPATGSGAPTSTGRAAAPATTTRAGIHPSIRVVPASGLHDGQLIALHGRGFPAGAQLQVIECADRGNRTGPGDCNLAGMRAVVANADGTVSARLTVVRGPFGGNGISCSARQKCLVSMTQASLTPQYEADAPIDFAAPPPSA